MNIAMQRVNEVLQNLVEKHNAILQLSLRKTETIKTGNIEALSELLMEERQLTQQVAQLERNRIETVSSIFQQHEEQPMDKTVDDLLSLMKDETERSQLEKQVVALAEVIVEIKQNEQLNKSLIEQSMQFVQLSLEMMQPTMQTINYNEERKGQRTSKNRSVFDSKA